jgi:putative phosphoribosyl transferase
MTSRYFTSRTQAGQMLANLVAADYAGKPCAVVALSEGGVMVGAQLALKLKSVLGLLLVESINLPAELDPIGAVDEKGSFTYNNNTYSAGQIEELMMDYRGYVEDQKRTGMTRMHTLLGRSTGLRPELLTDKHIFLVTDGLNNGFSLDIAMEFLKPITYRELIVATPIASPEAVDRMHVMADKIYCLSVVDNYLATDHYYERKDVPHRNDVVKIVEEIMEQWR